MKSFQIIFDYKESFSGIIFISAADENGLKPWKGPIFPSNQNFI